MAEERRHDKILKGYAMKKILVPAVLASLGFGQMTGLDIMTRVDNNPEPRSLANKLEMILIENARGRIKERKRNITRNIKNYETGKYKSKSLIRFHSPPDVKGTGFLMWEYRSDQEDDQWLFLPALGRPRRIIAREKSSSFMGSDLSYEDLGGREIDQDTFELTGHDVIEGDSCYVVRAVPNEKGSTYSKRVYWIDAERWILRKVEFYDRKNRLFKIMNIEEFRFDDPYWTTLLMNVENVQTGHKTIMRISDVQYDFGIGDDFFTERYLVRNQ